ncbi:MAG: aminotransferase class I/II-fold pyridoxal phosphate-dependent enzyme [Saprospiraceae bacterium]|uniref:Aminotransferase class I/II-fold pyridoxal phosphate-dependent enzyme n=1 Tax=Candidatus Opimibacter skivensis TaxID=2982028 RepID=A0A9D7SWH9_9BACT|nr:aminotransferase class I/II-fold pyridoxal phosphate-dependent enzyme [Candidatus Opimibacter skivensis]
MSLKSKLPDVGTTIFTVMSRLATQHQAINLSQGFPDFDTDPRLIAFVEEALRGGHNQYAPMPGLPDLVQMIAEKIKKDYGWRPDPDTEITVTAGGTQALYSIIGAMISQGDEVIVLEPSYDSYIPSVISFGGSVKTVQLLPPSYKVDWDEVESLITDRTKLIMINTPHNPCGVTLEMEDLKRLEEIVVNHGIYLISDEVYEHIIFDGHRHESVLRYPELYKRSFVVFSFGKSLHVTGWKIGYVIAPPALTTELRKIHQFNVFSVNRPIQLAIAKYIQHHGDFAALASFYQDKRDLFLKLMEGLPLKFLPCFGSYFILADYSEVSDLDDRAFAQKLTIEGGVATIPLSPFYKNGSEEKIIRFCFAKKEETLVEAASRLKNYFNI